MLKTTIRHIIVVPESTVEDNSSLFQGFSPEILEEYLWVIGSLNWVPHDVLEISMNPDNYIRFRMTGSGLDVCLLREDLLDADHIGFDRFFNIIWSTESTQAAAAKFCSGFLDRPIHVSTIPGIDIVLAEDLTYELMTSCLIQLIERVVERIERSEFSKELEACVARGGQSREKGPLPFVPIRHNCIIPSIKTLESYGYSIDQLRNVHPSGSNDEHISSIVEAASLIDEIRTEYQEPGFGLRKSDAIIFCPSIFSALYKMKSKFWVNLVGKWKKQDKKFLKKALIRNRGFGNASMEIEEVYNPYESPLLGPLLAVRQKELSLNTAIVSAVSVSEWAPAIRFPSSVMLHHDVLARIATHIRLGKFNRLLEDVGRYSQAIVDDVGDDLLECTFHGRSRILAICDFPIEWVNIGGIPIQVSHEITRICPTPGDLFLNLALGGQRMIVPWKAFREVLVIRSFQDKDPIENTLEEVLNFYKNRGCYENIAIRMVDVSTEDELLAELDAFSGALVVFDCHGGHGGNKQNAWLEIGVAKVDIWGLANRCQMPPIVILSACSTHPIDGSHASVASGFLRCGSITVMGTHAEVDAAHSAVVVARILYRLAEYVPMVVKERFVSWREVVNGFLRTSYVTDVLQGLVRRQKLIDDQQLTDIHTKLNLTINTNGPEWETEFIQSVSQSLGMEPDEFRNFLSRDYCFVQTMLYAQYGRPENILICK